MGILDHAVKFPLVIDINNGTVALYIGCNVLPALVNFNTPCTYTAT